MDDFKDIVALQAYVPRNVIAVVTRYPDNADEYMRAVIRSLIEIHPTYIGDFYNGFNVNYHRHDSTVNPLGVLQVHTRAINVRMNYDEKYGRAIENAYRAWTEIGGEISIDVLFIEPDSTGTKAVLAWQGKKLKPDVVEAATSYHEPMVVRSPATVEVRFAACDIVKNEQALADANKFLAAVGVRRAETMTTQADELLKFYDQLDTAIRTVIDIFVPKVAQPNQVLHDRPVIEENLFREELVKSLHSNFKHLLLETLPKVAV